MVGICDLSATLVEAVADRYGVGPGFTDYARMLGQTEPDVVHVLTPPGVHRGQVLDAFAHGAHAFVEKPIAPRLAEYEEMRDAAAAAGLMLVENYNYLFMDDVQRALDLLRLGQLGELVNLDISMGVGLAGAAYADPEVPHFAHRLPGARCVNFASHPASIAVSMLGEWGKVAVAQRRLVPDLPVTTSCGRLSRASGGRRRSRSRATRARSGSPSSCDARGRRSMCDVLGQRIGIAREGSPLAEVGDEARQGLGRVVAAAGRVRRATMTREGYFQGFEKLLAGFDDAVLAGGEPPFSVAEMDGVNRLVEALFAPENQL